MLWGCLIILAALAVVVGLWWVLAVYVFSTGDDGPTVGEGRSAAVAVR
jgi:hypothetical protein